MEDEIKYIKECISGYEKLVNALEIRISNGDNVADVKDDFKREDLSVGLERYKYSLEGFRSVLNVISGNERSSASDLGFISIIAKMEKSHLSYLKDCVSHEESFFNNREVINSDTEEKLKRSEKELRYCENIISFITEN